MSAFNSPHSGEAATHSTGYSGSVAVRSNGLAVAALVLGILAVLTFWTILGGIVLGVLAVIFGIVAARRARGGRAKHHMMSVIGAILGGLALIVSAALLALGVSFLNSDDFKNYKDCMDHANSKSDEQHCAHQFSHDVKNDT